MKTCPVLGCETDIQADRLVCHQDWMRLLDWARSDLIGLLYSEGETDLYQRTVAAALAYLNETAAHAEVAS
jgi:hypothetical protein